MSDGGAVTMVSQRLEIAGPAGRLEALLDEPSGTPRAAVVFGHPHPLHGGSMHTKVVFRGGKALAGLGCAVARFNFRGVGASAGVHDEGRGEIDDFAAVLDFMSERYPGTPLWSAGFSFGAFVALTAGARAPRVSLLVAVAPPVDRADLLEALRSCVKPKFFIHGERDEIIPLTVMRRFYGLLPEPKELVVIDGADHLFDGKTLEVADAIEDLLGDWTST